MFEVAFLDTVKIDSATSLPNSGKGDLFFSLVDF
jgi:hypothetical protein